MDQQKLTVHENKNSSFNPASLWKVPAFWSQVDLAPIVWSNDIFSSTRRNMAQMMEGFFENWPALKAHTATDVTEDQRSLRISMDVPGLEAEDIDISTEDGMLVISADKHESVNGTESRYSFSYSTSLPEEARLDAADVRLANHKLSIDIPKTNGHEPLPRKAAGKTRHRKQRKARR